MNSKSTSRSSVRTSIRSTLSQSTRKIINYRQEMKIALLFVAVGGMYSATWIPVLYMTTMQIFDRADLIPEKMSETAIFIMAGNSLVDPLLYGLYMNDLRCRLKAMVFFIFGNNKVSKNKIRQRTGI